MAQNCENKNTVKKYYNTGLIGIVCKIVNLKSLRNAWNAWNAKTVKIGTLENNYTFTVLCNFTPATKEDIDIKINIMKG